MNLTLTQEHFLGKGTNKIVYYHPQDPNKCIKFSLDKSDETDLKYELQFRKICKSRIDNSTLLTKYYGTVNTNKGTGYVFEVVRDFDGNLSETFLSIFTREKNSPYVLEILTRFKKQMLKDSMITYTLFPDNFLIQRTSPSEYRIRIIDGIGMHVLLPLPYYSKFLARQRQKKIWQRFMKMLHSEYGLQGEI